MDGRAPRLLAVSDLHVASRDNRAAVQRIPDHPGDWLVIAGDVGEEPAHLTWTLDQLGSRFDRIVWVPGNHDLWTMPRGDQTRGEARYRLLVELCRERGVATPEDDFLRFPSVAGPVVVAPLFVLYDYSFREPGRTKEEALALAEAARVVCADEYLLDPHPHASREDWCEARVCESERRLDALPVDLPTVLVAHFPLRRDLIDLPYVPQFALWCGTTRTDDWHSRYRAVAVVSGHTHRPATAWRDGVRFEEVSFGNPAERRRRGVHDVTLREILPG